MSDDTEWVRSRVALALLTSAGMEQWEVLQRLRFALVSGAVRGRAQIAQVGQDEFHEWEAPRSVWGADIMVSTLSLRLDEYTAQHGATPGYSGVVRLAGMSFHSADLTAFFELGSLPSMGSAAPASTQTDRRAGRKKGQDFYPNDKALVGRIIARCDGEGLPLRTVISELVREIEPVGQDNDASKKRRIREKVLEKRPDLRGS